MKDTFDLKINADGTIETIYQDGIETFADEIGGPVSVVCRASEVEWEESVEDGTKKGWTVRSSKDHTLAIRSRESGNIIGFNCSRSGSLHFFRTREEALQVEITFFWELRNG